MFTFLQQGSAQESLDPNHQLSQLMHLEFDRRIRFLDSNATPDRRVHV